MPNDAESSALNSVLKKLTPRVVAILLIAVILSFVVVILIAINKGAEVNFWGIEITPKNQTDPPHAATVPGGITAREFVASLPVEVQGTVEASRMKIVAALNEARQQSAKLTRVREERNSLQRAIAEKEDKFLNRIIRLEDEITRWEGSINTNFKVDEKRAVFLLVQQLLRRIGHYDGPIDADPIRTRKALSHYKQDKDMDEELWTHVTRQTVIFIVRDYAETLLKESRG